MGGTILIVYLKNSQVRRFIAMDTFNYKKISFLLFFFFTITLVSFSQNTNIFRDSSNTVLLKAGNYNKNRFYKLFWGEHYRKEWNTPVIAKKVLLDTMRGGLRVYQLGGSR